MSIISRVNDVNALLLGGILDADKVRVPVVLSNKNATPTEEADALLKSLGFGKDELAAWSKQHNGEDLRQKFIDHFTTNLRAGHVDRSGRAYHSRPDGKINAWRSKKD